MTSASPEDFQKKTVLQPIVPSLTAGGISGLVGVLIGGGVGTLRSAYPGLAAGYTGIQFFVAGTTFHYVRETTVTALSSNRVNRDSHAGLVTSRRNELIGSSVAGAVSGACAGYFWSRASTIPGALVLGTASFVGQKALHRYSDSPRTEMDRRPLMARLSDSRYWPIKNLSNDDYEGMLNEKIIQVEAQLAVLDEKLATLRELERGIMKERGENKDDS